MIFFAKLISVYFGFSRIVCIVNSDLTCLTYKAWRFRVAEQSCKFIELFGGAQTLTFRGDTSFGADVFYLFIYIILYFVYFQNPYGYPTVSFQSIKGQNEQLSVFRLHQAYYILIILSACSEICLMKLYSWRASVVMSLLKCRHFRLVNNKL